MPDETTDLGEVNAAIQGGLTPRPRAGPGSLVCGDIDIRIARDGTWFYHGSPIGRKRLVKLFSTVLRREEDGQYYLVTPVEKGRITVEDAPFLAVEMTRSGAGRDQILSLRTNVDDEVTVDDEHPIQVVHDPVTEEPSPYVRIRDNLDALIARSVYYELVAIAEPADDDDEQLGVWSAGRFFALGSLSASDA